MARANGKTQRRWHLGVRFLRDSVHAFAQKSEDSCGLAGLCRSDYFSVVTLRKRAEEALQLSELRWT